MPIRFEVISYHDADSWYFSVVSLSIFVDVCEAGISKTSEWYKHVIIWSLVIGYFVWGQVPSVFALMHVGSRFLVVTPYSIEYDHHVRGPWHQTMLVSESVVVTQILLSHFALFVDVPPVFSSTNNVVRTFVEVLWKLCFQNPRDRRHALLSSLRMFYVLCCLQTVCSHCSNILLLSLGATRK